MTLRLLLLTMLGSVTSALAEPLSGPVLERYEQMLLRAPEAGTAFDKIHQHYAEGEGLDALAARWAASAEKADAPKSDYLLLLGLLADRRGKTDEALKFLRAAAGAGESWRAWFALAATEARAGQLEAGVGSYRKALSLHPPADATPKLYRSLALCQQRLMDNDGAVETWQAYVKASPEDPFVIEEAGDALLEAARYEDAGAMYGRLRDLKDIDPAKKLSASLKLAEVERKQGNKEQALKILNAALAESGDASWIQREVRSRIEHLYRSDDDLPGLAKYYQERLATTSGDLEDALRLSETLTDLNRHEESLKVLETAAAKAPGNKDVHLRLAAAFLRAELPSEAEKTLAELETHFPADGVIIEQLGEAQWKAFKLGKGNQEDAKATWRKLAPAGADANAVQRLAEIFRAHDLAEEAVAEYRRALAEEPGANDRRERLADYLMQLDRKDEAAEELRGLVTDDRATGENYLRLARVQRRFGDTAAAGKTLEAAAKYEDRAFERQLLGWQIASEDKAWKRAETLALAMRQSAQTDPEIERADDCLAESLRGQEKTAGEIKRLLDSLGQAPDQFSERDFRLLFVLATDVRDNGSADYALSEGLRRFPKSALLARLDHIHARRINDQARRLAALERLEQLEPARAGDWMAERVRAYRDAARWDEAISLARQCVQISPAKPEAHILLADILLAGGKPDEAVKALQEAIRLSDNANQIRFRLADIYLTQARPAEARTVLEEAFEAEETPAGKLQLTNRLASVYLQDGKIDELVAKMRERQKAEQGGWRYALYLAEIYLMMQDTVRALEELDKALAGKPDDPVLLKKLYGLAETNGDNEAAVRYARQLVSAEPSPQNLAELGEALARSGRLDEAVEHIRGHGAGFLSDPDLWRETVSILQSEGRADELARLLESQLRANPGDWRSLMALGEILIVAGEEERAGGIYWQVMGLKDDPTTAVQPAPPAAPATAMVPGQPYFARRGIMGFTGGIPMNQSRQMRLSEIHQRAMQTLSGNRESLRFSRGIRYRPGLAQFSTGGGTLAEAQDEAMIYLACLSLRDGSEAEFLKKLGGSLADRTPEERLVIYNFLQAPDASVEEARRIAASGTKDSKATLAAYQALQMIASNRQAATASISDEELMSLMRKLGDMILDGSSQDDLLQRYQMLSMLGRRDEGEKLVDQIINGAGEDDAGALGMALQLALSRRDFEKAIGVHEKLKSYYERIGGNLPAGVNFNLALQLINSGSHRKKGIDLLAAEYAGGGGGSPAMVYGSYRRGMNVGQQLRGNLAQLLPFPTAELGPQQAIFLRNVSVQNPRFKEVMPEVIARFDQLSREKDSPALRQAAIWLRWFSGDEEGALREAGKLVKEAPSDGLLVNYSLMLMQNKKHGDALRAILQVQSRSGDTWELAARLKLMLAQRLADKELGRKAALEVAALRLPDYEIQELAQAMLRLDMRDEAETLNKRLTTSRSSRQRGRQAYEIMQERMEQGNRDEAVTLARATLSRDPLSRVMRENRHQQEAALRTLEKFGELKAYIDGLKEQLKAAPQSARINAQLGQALLLKEARDAIPYYRTLAGLKPNDREWQRQLGSLLVQATLDEEAMEVYDRLLLGSPETLLSQGTSFMEPYRRAGKLSRLVETIGRSPDPKRDPLNPNRQNFSGIFAQIGREIQQARPPIDATEIWLKGLRWDDGGAVQLRPIVVQSLMRAGREAEARQVIEEAFFPPGRDASSATIFVFNRQYRPNSLWSQMSFNGRGELESPAMNMMRTAATFGFLEELMPRLEKLPVSPDGTRPGLLARMVARDETVLPEIEGLIEKGREAKSGAPLPGNVNLNVMRVIGGELANWPKARETSYRALEVAARLSTLNSVDFGTQMGLELQRAAMALEDGRREIAQGALRNWAKAGEEWKRQGAQIDGQIGCKVLRFMALAGLATEAKELADALRNDQNFTRNTYLQRLLRQAENEMAIILGKEGKTVAAVAWAPGTEGGRVLWDLRGAGGDEQGDRTVWMAEQPLSSLAGTSTLEVYFGPDESSMRRIFTKAKVPSRGFWTGKLPEGQGYLRAVLRKGEEMNLGPAVFVADGRVIFSPDNLKQVPNAKGGTAPGWTSIPSVATSFEKGGPTGNGYLRLEGDRQNELELTGERIPLSPSKNYMAGGWFRYRQNDGNVRLGCRFYDENGKKLQDTHAGGNFQGDRWNQASQNLGTGKNSSSIPERAAWMEPFVVFSGRVDLQDIFVVEIERRETD